MPERESNPQSQRWKAFADHYATETPVFIELFYPTQHPTSLGRNITVPFRPINVYCSFVFSDYAVQYCYSSKLAKIFIAVIWYEAENSYPIWLRSHLALWVRAGLKAGFHFILFTPPDGKKFRILQLFIIRVGDQSGTENWYRKPVHGFNFVPIRSDTYFPVWKPGWLVLIWTQTEFYMRELRHAGEHLTQVNFPVSWALVSYEQPFICQFTSSKNVFWYVGARRL